MPENQTLITLLMYAQLFFVFRYVLKAIFGHAPEYKFYKLLIVFLLPIVGYFMMMKEPVEVE